MKFIVTALILILGYIVKAQEAKKFAFYWGYNRSAYTRCDLRVAGPGFDYTLHQVVADDKPEPFGWVYVDPTRLSIPQFNVRGSYQLNKKWELSLGYDHMKYVLRPYQETTISGNIKIIDNTTFNGDYNNEQIKITPDFLWFEHTDGLNFISFDVHYSIKVWQHQSKPFGLSSYNGMGLGFLLPRTNATLFGKQGPDIFNLAGFGLSAQTQLRFFAGKHFFALVSLKSGFIRMHHIKPMNEKNVFAQQQFGFIEKYWAIGYTFDITSKKNR